MVNKKKLKISGNIKKPISNIELAKSQNKNTVVIEKKPSNFVNKGSFKRSLNSSLQSNQKLGLKNEEFLKQKPQKQFKHVPTQAKDFVTASKSPNGP